MRRWMMILGAALLAGCSSGPKVARNEPRVLITAEPIHIANGPAAVPRSTQRAQTMVSPSAAARTMPTDVSDPRPSIDGSSDEPPPPRPHRKKRHKLEESSDTRPVETPKQPKPKEKGFDDLSPEERRKLIEGG